MFARQVCNINETSSTLTIPRSSVDEAEMYTCRKRLKSWDQAANWSQNQKHLALKRALTQSPMLDISYEGLQEYESVVGDSEEGHHDSKETAALERSGSKLLSSPRVGRERKAGKRGKPTTVMATSPWIEKMSGWKG
ncbi:hypothetical protein ACMFMF_005926 [Clarireedia jacksonii]